MCSIKNSSVLKISALLVAALIFLVGCSHINKDEASKVDLKNSKYIISLSRAREPYSKLLFLNSDGTLLQSFAYEGYSINSVNYFNEKIFLTSNRLNEHYILNSNGVMEKYSNKNEQKNNKYLASWFTSTGDKTLIETVNIGKTNDKYFSSVLYSYEGQKKESILENQYLNGALDTHGKIFVESYSENDQKNGITVIDKRSAKIEKRIYFQNGFTSSSGKLIEYGYKIVTYGNNNSNDFQNTEEQAAIGLVGLENYETKEYLFDKEKIIFLYIYEDSIYAITDSNSVYVFNNKLEMIEQKEILDTSFFDNFANNDFVIRKIIYSDSVLSVLYTSRHFNEKNLGFIAEYNSGDISLLKKFNILLKDEKVWLGEVVDFIKLE